MKIQWLSHAVVKIETDSHNILIDPFLSGNPKAPLTWEEAAKGVTHILLTHGHGDHIGDTVAIAKKHNIPVIAMVELAQWLTTQGAPKVEQANFGGPIDLGNDHSVTLVPAWHSAGGPGGEYFGVAAGLIVETPEHTIYHAGDTSVFGDMALIHDMYKPSIGFLPIGGRFTMDGINAAYAAKKFFKFKHIFPIHYGTFGLLDQTADSFVQAGKGLPIQVLEIGETVELK